MIATVVDMTLAALLLVTIVSCCVVHRRIAGLRVEHTALRGLVEALVKAADRAEAVSGTLSRAGDEVEGKLQAMERRTSQAGDALGRLLAEGEGLSDRLARQLRDAAAPRSQAARIRPAGSRHPARPISESVPGSAPRSAPLAAERDLAGVLAGLR